MKTKNFNITETYLLIQQAFGVKGKRFFVNQGGSRSGKTYAICQFIFKYLQENPGKKVSVVRMTWPALRDTVMLDFFEILKSFDLYDVRRHNKTEHNYTFANGSVIEFFATDSDQKVRGRKRDLLFCNEANELSNDVFRQLVMRTKGKILLDFNPSDADHWIYNLLEENNTTLIKTTYKNNGFLEQDQIDYIENLIHTDQNYYRIYALGERPVASIRIYSHFKMYEELPEKIDDVIYGLDFGFNHPTSLIKISWSDGVAYVEEMLYKNHLTSNDIVVELNKLGIDKDAYIYADYARPEIIEDLRRDGFNMKEANKSVIAGIDTVKSSKIFINKNSVNLMDEYRKYSWKSRGEQIIDEPIKLFDDCMDAMRYAIHSYKDQTEASDFGFF